MGIEQNFLFICAVRDLRKPMIGPIIFGSLAASNARGAARHIRAEAGSVKTEDSQRKVPLHPQVIDEGFFGFVESIKEGPLFYDRRRRKPGAKKPAQKIVAKNVAAWVHRLELDVGLQHRKGPSHAWRHLFHATARELGIEEEVIEAIIGHAAKTVGRAGCVACDG